MTIPHNEAREWVAANIDTLSIVVGKCTKCELLLSYKDMIKSSVELEGVVPGTNYTVDVLARHSNGGLIGIEVADTQYTSHKKMFQCKQAGTTVVEVTTVEIQGAIDAVSKVLRTTTTATSVVCDRCSAAEQGANKKRKTEATEETETIEDLLHKITVLEKKLALPHPSAVEPFVPAVVDSDKATRAIDTFVSNRIAFSWGASELTRELYLDYALIFPASCGYDQFAELLAQNLQNRGGQWAVVDHDAVTSSYLNIRLKNHY
jgi:hypothetical protein